MIDPQELFCRTPDDIAEIADRLKQDIADFDRDRVDPQAPSAKKMFAAKEKRLDATRKLYAGIDVSQAPERIAVDLARLQGIESEILEDIVFLSMTDDFRKECLASITVCGQVLEEMERDGLNVSPQEEGEDSDG